MANEKAKEIDLGDFNIVRLKATNGVAYELRQTEKGSLFVSSEQGSFEFPPANINTPKTATAIAAAQKAVEIGDVAADGWYCIDDKKKIEMSPPVIMTWEQAAYLTWNKDAQKVFLDEVLADPVFPKNKQVFRLPGNSAATKEFNKLSNGKWDKFATVNNNALNAGRDKASLIYLPDNATLKKMFSVLSANPKMRAAIEEGKVKDLDRTGSFPPARAARVWGTERYGVCARVQYSDDGGQTIHDRYAIAEARFARRDLARS